MVIRREGGLVEQELTGEIIGAFFEVYRVLGYGHAENTYMNALEYELVGRGLTVAREVNVRVYYKDHEVGFHRLDRLVNDRVVVEGKATELLPPYAQRQLRNYLTATRIEVGLLLHFGPKPRHYRVFCPNGLARLSPLPSPETPAVSENQT